jgi:hypothetical protein
MSESNVTSGLPKSKPSEKLQMRYLQICQNINDKTRCKLNQNRFIYKQYIVTPYYMNYEWVEVHISKNDTRILVIRDTGNIAKIIDHIKIAIS